MITLPPTLSSFTLPPPHEALPEQVCHSSGSSLGSLCIA